MLCLHCPCESPPLLLLLLLLHYASAAALSTHAWVATHACVEAAPPPRNVCVAALSPHTRRRPSRAPMPGQARFNHRARRSSCCWACAHARPPPPVAATATAVAAGEGKARAIAPAFPSRATPSPSRRYRCGPRAKATAKPRVQVATRWPFPLRHRLQHPRGASPPQAIAHSLTSSRSETQTLRGRAPPAAGGPHREWLKLAILRIRMKRIRASKANNNRTQETKQNVTQVVSAYKDPYLSIRTRARTYCGRAVPWQLPA